MKKNQSYEVHLGNDSRSRMIRRIIRFLERFRVNRKFKDRLFVMLLMEKKNILMLYNALNGTAYTNEENLEITTIDDAVYMGMKNDCSFIIGNQLNLYEHQSTFCGNMPFRGLIYLSNIYRAYIASHEYDIYGERQIQLPAPRFIVFYNGTDRKQDQELLRLSDAFGGDDSCLEFKAVMYNINYGHNQELMEQCRILSDYAAFIEYIRRYQAEGYTLKMAIDMATDDCINQDILREFLIKNRSEVIDVLLTEYNEKKHMKMIRRDARAEGRAEGKAEGKAEDILTLLMHYGQVSEQLRTKIKAEEDVEVLDRWFALAVKADSVEEFEKKI